MNPNMAEPIAALLVAIMDFFADIWKSLFGPKDELPLA